MTKRTITRLTTAALVVGAMAVTAAPASASHDHYILTPGTCVVDVADGQTSKEPNESGGHVFHWHVHNRSFSNGTGLGDLTDRRVQIKKLAEMSPEDLAYCGL